MHTGLSVVIPNYNGTVLFPHTLPTVLSALQNLTIPYELVIADDCSTDDSINYLKQYYPQARLVTNQKNSGFSVTANMGISAARYDLVFLLNSDVKLEPDYFKEQFKYFDNPGIFGVMGRIVGWDDDIVQDGAKFPSFHTAKIKTSLNYLSYDEAEMKDGLYTMYLSGANALIDRNKFLALGGFNEIFSPFYVEDYELSLRAWRLGWKCMYEHQSVCRHKTSTTIKTKSRKWFIKMVSNRNKMYLHAIHLDFWWKVLWLVQMLPEVLVQSLLGKTYYIQAFSQYLKNGKGIRSSKEKLRKLAGDKKLLSVQEVAQLIRDSIKNKKVRFF